MRNHSLLATILIVLVLSSCATKKVEEQSSKKAKRPNIIFLVAEDFSQRLAAYGDSLAYTPTIDSISSVGTVYNSVFTTAGVCAPSRAAIITGMYSTAIGTHHMRQAESVIPMPGKPNYNAVPRPDIKAFPEVLRENGYWTASYTKTDYQFGKPFTIWDSVYESSTHAYWRDREDDSQPFFCYYTFEITHEINVWPDWRKEEFFKEKNLDPSKLAEDAVKRPALDEKYFVDPNDVTLPPYYPDTKTVRQDIARHYTNAARMDTQIKTVLASLKEDGLLDNTIIMFFGDHGDALPRAKRWIYDSGIKIPLIISGPGVKNGVDEQLISGVDLAPTVLSLAGVEIPDNIHGKAFLGAQKADSVRKYVFAGRDRMDNKYDMIRAVRDDRYKFIKNYDHEKPYTQPIEFMYQMPMMREILALEEAGKLNKTQSYWLFDTKPEVEFYDLENDPHELNNLAAEAQYSDKIAEMEKELKAWQGEFGDLGFEDEFKMAERMWPGMVQPETAKPEITQTDDHKVAISNSTEGASIGYQISGQKGWKLYTEPIALQAGQTLSAKAIRYGFKESAVTQFSLN